MKITNVQVTDTMRNAVKEITVCFDKKTSLFKEIKELEQYLGEIKAGIIAQMPRFQDEGNDKDWTIYETVEGNEMADEWELSLSESELWGNNWEEDDYEGEGAFELTFELDVVETKAQ